MTSQSLEQILKGVTQQPQWEKYQQFDHLIKCWHKIVNDKIAQHTRIVYLKNQVLWVAVSSSVWAQNLSLQRYTLVQKLNQLLDQPLIDIRFSPGSWNSLKNLTTNPNYSPDLEQYSSNLDLDQQLFSELNLETPQTPQQALHNWLEVIKLRSQFMSRCPICQSPTPEVELKRWQMCGYCAIKQDENG